MTSPDNVRCETCRFWKPVNEYGGWCKRYPPQLVVLAVHDPAHSSPETHFPWSAATEWCGEHQPKEPTP
jgi:hypothetical protein